LSVAGFRVMQVSRLAGHGCDWNWKGEQGLLENAANKYDVSTATPEDKRPSPYKHGANLEMGVVYYR